ncbi:MAG: phosphoribosylamine--glycine ligase, partial [Proteobacteria bacterium]|nr:phosphoribosylamine--glycine ligase [Pseudomonadota bacterium]
MKILVIGSGGREHALAWKLASSGRVTGVYVAPGNAGTALEPGVTNIDIDPMDFDGLIAFVQRESVDLTVVGPEDPLVAGIVDRFQAAGLKCFGPSRLAAQLEGSKSFTKAFLEKYGIPTAGYRVFEAIEPALEYVSELTPPIVIKADGLAAGKGVVIAGSREEAGDTIRDMLSGNLLGGAGSRIVIEEFLEGEEASFIVIADGERYLPFASSQDHKAAYDGDRGPNTGGMGAYSPAPVVTDEVHQLILQRVIEPTIAGLRSEGSPYTGFLYAGLMIDKAGNPRVIEFNCRFGDPETQPILSR